MKRWLTYLLVCTLTLSFCLVGCGKQETNILFGESKETVFEYFKVKQEDAVNVLCEPQEQTEPGMHLDTYSFKDIAFSNLKATGINVMESYLIDDNGKRHDLGVTAIQWVFPGDAYKDTKEFEDAVTPILEKDKNYKAYDSYAALYDSKALTEEQWSWLAENTRLSKGELGVGYVDSAEPTTEKPMIEVTITGVPGMNYSVMFSSVIFSNVKNQDAAKAIMEWADAHKTKGVV